MSKNPYEVLGLVNGASKEEVEAAYLRLRDKYRLDMHSEGARGKEAARKLNEVENAYADILVNYAEGGVKVEADNGLHYEQTQTQTQAQPQPEIVDNEYNAIEQLIRDKRFSDAQRALDDIDNRNANWHYYQSVIYYKLGRMQESKAQLELACSMDPGNQRFQNSLRKLNEKLNATHTQPVYSNDGYSRSYNDDYRMRSAEDSCCQACQAMLCLNCLCNCCSCR